MLHAKNSVIHLPILFSLPLLNIGGLPRLHPLVQKFTDPGQRGDGLEERGEYKEDWHTLNSLWWSGNFGIRHVQVFGQEPREGRANTHQNRSGRTEPSRVFDGADINTDCCEQTGHCSFPISHFFYLSL